MSELELTDIDGVGPGRASTLNGEGFGTVEDVAFSSVEDIAGGTGIPETTIESIIESATDLLEDVDGGEEASDGVDGSDDDAGGRSDGGSDSETTESDTNEITPEMAEPDDLDPHGFDPQTAVGVDSAPQGQYILPIDLPANTLLHVIHVVLEEATKKEQTKAFDYRDYAYRVAQKLMVALEENGDTVETDIVMTRKEVRSLYRAITQGVSDYSSRSGVGDLWGQFETFREEVNEVRE